MAKRATPKVPPQNSSSPPLFIGTESEIRIQRYRQVERKADAMGRVIGVRRLKPSEQGRLQGYTADLGGQEEVENPDTGEMIKVSHKTPYFIAATVCEIDGVHIMFPRNRGELDSIYDRLDVEGVTAAAQALAILNPTQPKPEVPDYLETGDTGPSPEEEEETESLAEAKNS